MLARSRQKSLRAALVIALAALPLLSQAGKDCKKVVYLTFDTGHMGVADLIADVLQRHQVPVTFFAAHERTQQGDGSLGDYWAPWWAARAREGHAFASHTWDHVSWQADLSGLQSPAFLVRPSSGANPGQSVRMTATQYCQQLDRAAQRLEQITGQKTLPLFRAPGGKTSGQLLATAKSCGYTHVGWASAGFLGDELNSDKYPNNKLLSQALANIRSGDILMAHLGIWSRKDAWAPAVLEPLIQGLHAKGFCFRTLREHPTYASLVR